MQPESLLMIEWRLTVDRLVADAQLIPDKLLRHPSSDQHDQSLDLKDFLM